MILTTILLTKITAVQNEVALNYHNVRGKYFLVGTFVILNYTSMTFSFVILFLLVRVYVIRMKTEMCVTMNN